MNAGVEPRRSGWRAVRSVAFVPIGIVAVALAAQVQVPLDPVPVTLQTAVMFFVAILLGPWIGAFVAAGYFAAAAAGLPVLSDWDSFARTGLAEARTLGYVAAFLPASLGLGWLSRRGRLDDFFAATFAVLGAHLLVLLAGAAWLCRFVDVGAAWTHGVAPFFVGGVAKSALVGAAVWFCRGTQTRAAMRR